MQQADTLYYVYDPMCSWCWGFKPVWEQVKAAYKDRLDIVYVLGGLAPETDEPMPMDMREYLQQSWRRIQSMCEVPFNFDFWTRNTPRRSTYPACKACLVARDYGKELAMYERIQRYYYQEAGNPSLYENLCDLAAELGLPRNEFAARIHSDEIDAALRDEILFAERLGAQGYPSVILRCAGQLHFIQHDYTDLAENLRRIQGHLDQA